METIKAIGVKVIAHPVAPPPLAHAGVGSVAAGVGPAHSEVRSLRCDERQRLIHDQLVVPLPVLSGAVTDTQEDVGTHAVVRMKQMRDCQ